MPHRQEVQALEATALQGQRSDGGDNDMENMENTERPQHSDGGDGDMENMENTDRPQHSDGGDSGTAPSGARYSSIVLSGVRSRE